MICGMDEVGRGPLAGPIVGAAVVLAKEIKVLRDSKKLSAIQRQKLYKNIVDSGAVIAVEMISVRSINIKGIGWANKEIFRRLKKRIPADEYIADGNLKIAGIKSVIKADSKVPEVMAASIIAKVWRDKHMQLLHAEYPMYGWKSNMGYGTKEHIAALKAHGPCKHHRKLFIRTALK